MIFQRVALTWEPNRFQCSHQACSYLPIKGGPIGLQLRASNEGLLRPRVPRAKETNGPPLPSHTGRGAKPAGLVSDRTRSFSSLEFLHPPLEFLPIFQLVARISSFVVRMTIMT